MAKSAGTTSDLFGEMEIASRGRAKNTKKVNENTAAIEKNIAAMKKQIISLKKANKEGKLWTRGLRNQATSLSVLRSKLLLVAFGYGLIIERLTNLVKMAGKQQAAEDRLRSALISTAGAAGLSTKQLKEYAVQLQKSTGVSDELTLESSALLATFTKINKETFPEAIESILDVTVAMNQGKVSMETLKTTTIQIGKALNDPIKGLSALSRVGIQFTKQQKDLIKTFVNSGEVSKAQAVIIEELNNQYGDRAKIENYEKSLRSLESAAGDLGERLGFTLMSSMKELNDTLTKMAESLNPSDIADYVAAITTLATAYLILTRNTRAAVAAQKMFKRTIGGLILLMGTEFISGIFEVTGAFDSLDDSLEPVINKSAKLKESLAIMSISDLHEQIGAKKKSIELLEKEIRLNNELPKSQSTSLPTAIGDIQIIEILPEKQTEIIKNNVKLIDQSHAIIELNKSSNGQAIEQIELLKKQIKDIEKLIETKSADIAKTEQQLNAEISHNKNMSKLLAERRSMYLDFIDSVRDSYMTSQQNMIDSELDANLKIIESDRQRMDNQFMLESERIRKDRQFDKREDDARKKSENDKKSLQKKSIMIDTAMTLGQIAIKLAQTLASIQAKWALIPGGGIFAGTESRAAKQNAGMQAAMTLVGQGLALSAFGQGGDFVTSGPRMIMVGDNPGGRERVQVTPLSSPNVAGPNNSGTVNVKFNNSVKSEDYTEDVIIPQIKEAINRGADIGIS